jgi:hypothetical protein
MVGLLTCGSSRTFRLPRPSLCRAGASDMVEGRSPLTVAGAVGASGPRPFPIPVSSQTYSGNHSPPEQADNPRSASRPAVIRMERALEQTRHRGQAAWQTEFVGGAGRHLPARPAGCAGCDRPRRKCGSAGQQSAARGHLRLWPRAATAHRLGRSARQAASARLLHGGVSHGGTAATAIDHRCDRSPAAFGRRMGSAVRGR